MTGILRRMCRLESACRLFGPRVDSGFRSSSTVSPNFPTESAMVKVLDKAGVPNTAGHTCFRVKCPSCEHMGKTEPVEGYLNKKSGTYICFECQYVAEWSEFARHIHTKEFTPDPQLHSAFTTPEEQAEISRRLRHAVRIAKMAPADVRENMNKLCLDRVSPAILIKEGYRMTFENGNEPRLLLPLKSVTGKVVGLKYVSPEKSETYPDRELIGLFTTSSRKKKTIIVTDPIDAIIVTQETLMGTICLESSTRLPLVQLPLFEKSANLIMWFEARRKEWANAKSIALKLGIDRCYYIKQTPEFERPRTTKDFSRPFMEVIPFQNASLIPFSKVREQLRDELLSWEKMAGKPWLRFPALTKLLKGHRRGELTIFTGQTGSGKTTFLSEYSLDLMLQGVPTLWGSFEIPNTRLLRTMISQFALLPISDHLEQYDEIADEFDKLPLMLMKFHGEQKISSVVGAMTHAVYVHDIQHIVLDNLQFMLGVSQDRFLQQDRALSIFRSFATEHNVHITLVVHPRKESAEEKLNTASIFGSAKASQEADNVLILQTSPRGTKFIQATKNRFDGDVGAFPLLFDKSSLSYWKKVKEKLELAAAKAANASQEKT